jgi:lipooligosaccharide transport system ATP-binding protein
VGSEIVEMDNTPEVIACLTDLGVPFEAVGDQVQVATDASRELAKTLLDRCKTSRVSTRPATLEDVFLKLTGRTLRE